MTVGVCLQGSTAAILVCRCDPILAKVVGGQVKIVEFGEFDGLMCLETGRVDRYLLRYGVR